MSVNTYHILHTPFLSLMDYALGCYSIFNPIWRLDAIVGWHITSRSRVERQGKFFNSKNKLSVLPNHLTHTLPDLLQYLIPWARVGEATSAANDAKQSAELWTWLEEQVKDI